LSGGFVREYFIRGKLKMDYNASDPVYISWKGANY
jgi:hypothetical protein